MKISKLLPNIQKYSLQDLSKRISRVSSDPYIDWALIVAIWAVSFVIFAGVGYWTAGRVSREINSPQIDKSVIVTKIFDEQKLKDVLGEFDNRKQEWVRLKDGDYSFPSDPSL